MKFRKTIAATVMYVKLFILYAAMMKQYLSKKKLRAKNPTVRPTVSFLGTTA